MWAYTSDENSWLSRAGKVVMDYCEKIGTARANRYLNQHRDIGRYLTQKEKNFE